MNRRFFSGARTTPGVFATYGAAVAALSLAGWLAATPAAATRSRPPSAAADQTPVHAPRRAHRDDVCRELPPVAAPTPIVSCSAPAGGAP
jgi:hypothetical protein